MHNRTLALAGALFLSITTAYAFPLFVERTARAGQTVILFRTYAYISDRGCIPLPPGDINTMPKPKFGTVRSRSEVTVHDGPCGKMGYTTQTVEYTADTQGPEEFDLYYYFNTRDTGPERIHVKINMTGIPSTGTRRRQ